MALLPGLLNFLYLCTCPAHARLFLATVNQKWLCENFISTTHKKNITVHMEERFLCPLLYIMANGAAVGHPVSLTNITRITPIIRSQQFQSFRL
jgi:hypothetical protein